ncbi:4-diphosphocytidyl-2C-methyl-D-erythritol kinase, partial [Chloroflexota bacterium]
MLTIQAPAKINLTLEVLAKRQDGFHEIRSVMQAINLCDS